MPRGLNQPEESSALPSEKTICPSPEELSVINNNVKCEQCGLVFRNEPRYRLHDLKVHQRKKLDKIAKENARYHCPVQSCVYAVNSQRYFSTMKYLKQVCTLEYFINFKSINNVTLFFSALFEGTRRKKLCMQSLWQKFFY